MIPRFRQHGKDRLGRRCHGLGASSDWNTRCDWSQMLGIMAGIEGQFCTRSLLRSLSALAGACARLVLQVMLLALCSLSSVVKPKMLDTLAHMDQRDSYAALVVVTAVVCAWLVFLVTMLSRCVLFDCRLVQTVQV